MTARSNLEAMARAVTERVCQKKAAPGEDVTAWVDAHWYIAAADLEAGLIDENGDPLPGYTPALARKAVSDWLNRNPDAAVSQQGPLAKEASGADRRS